MIVEKLMELADDAFDDPGWMKEFFSDIVKKKQYIVTVDDEADISSFICYWKFGNKRWGFIRKCQFAEECPKQMGKGKHLYIPLFWIREDRRGTMSIKKFADILKRECADATTLSWHDENERFRTHELIRRKDNEHIQKEGSSVSTDC